MPDSPVIAAAIETFRRQKDLAERAIAQIPDAALHEPHAPGANPIAVVMKHMAGNMRSRWTDFLTTDGEKPWRNRDDEFIDDRLPRTDQLARWEAGWTTLFDALGPLTDADLARTITIRGEPITVARAVLRQIDHYAWHVSQIVTAARVLKGRGWDYLTVAPGRSSEYNRSMGYTAGPGDDAGR